MKFEKQFVVYILASENNHTLYVGVTSNLVKRMYEHKNELIDGFSKKYKTGKLVYYEIFESAESAITREKQLKAGSRLRKVELIDSFNSDWKDLSTDLSFQIASGVNLNKITSPALRNDEQA